MDGHFYSKYNAISLTLIFLLINLTQINGKGAEDYGLQLHNKYRKIHLAPDLVLNNDLNMRADKCVKHYLQKGVIDHSCPHKSTDDATFGENLYTKMWSGVPPDNADDESANRHVQAAIDGWYNEVKDYQYSKGGDVQVPGRATGHFTQVVWTETKQLGVAVDTEGQRAVVVCLYDPPGNMKGEYLKNVQQGTGPKGCTENCGAPGAGAAGRGGGGASGGKNANGTSTRLAEPKGVVLFQVLLGVTVSLIISKFCSN